MTMTKSRTSAALSFLVAGGLAVASLACSNEAPTPDRHAPERGRNPRAAAKAPVDAVAKAPANVNVADEYPMIVRLVGRHQTIVVTAGPAGKGPLYSAERNDGTLIVAAATLDELRKDHPEVYQQLIPAMATPRAETSKRKDQDKKEDVADASRGPVSSSRDDLRMGLMLMSADR